MNIVSLFDMSGIMVTPWAEAGCECYCFDEIAVPRSETVGYGNIHYIKATLPNERIFRQIVELRPAVIFSFAPCTDLAGSGARHYEDKFLRDPLHRAKALELVVIAESLSEEIGCEWMFENPIGVLSTIWRKPNYIFDPCDYGGYLPVDDSHPFFPEYIEPRDAYTKKTGIWHSRGLLEPKKIIVQYRVVEDWQGNRFSKQAAMLGGKSLKTKVIRSLTPRGFARAKFEANYPALLQRSMNK